MFKPKFSFEGKHFHIGIKLASSQFLKKLENLDFAYVKVFAFNPKKLHHEGKMNLEKKSRVQQTISTSLKVNGKRETQGLATLGNLFLVVHFANFIYCEASSYEKFLTLTKTLRA